MMKNTFLLLIIFSVFGCSNKLDLKPDSSLVIPKTAQDIQSLLENADETISCTPALAQLSSDEYFISDLPSWHSLSSVISRNTYIWAKDIFPAQNQVRSWVVPYSQVFYGNSVLDILNKQNIDDNAELKNIKGWALFIRGHAFYTLASNYAKAYNLSTANSDLGIPIKLSSDITQIVQRGSLQETYNQIIKDITEASVLLKQDIIIDKRNRPSKVAAYALLARIYLSMRDYTQSEAYADKALGLYSKLTDYNTLVVSGNSSFTLNSDETIYFTHQLGEFPETTYSTSAFYGVDSNLISLYQSNDLRRSIYFTKNTNGYYVVNKGINTDRGFPFTGLAVDELYLIKAECSARKQKKEEALSYLNDLIKTRVKTGTFSPLTSSNAAEALELVLTERRKELIWRSLRWTDIKRLNMEGRNIVLTRNLSGKVYSIEPNSPRYVFPIPDDELALSGIQQNIR